MFTLTENDNDIYCLRFLPRLCLRRINYHCETLLCDFFYFLLLLISDCWSSLPQLLRGVISMFFHHDFLLAHSIIQFIFFSRYFTQHPTSIFLGDITLRFYIYLITQPLHFLPYGFMDLNDNINISICDIMWVPRFCLDKLAPT